MADEYHLLDFGRRRKLESFSGYVIDRPSPAAATALRKLRDWNHADAVFDESARQWQFRRPWPESLHMAGPGFRLPVCPTPFGHLQVFPEQQPHWHWLQQKTRQLCELDSTTPPQALNLFAYTGGSTFAMATGGAATVHVDAARPNVATAKSTSISSGLSHLPIRYLVDDALKFVKREQRRGHVYQVVALDPPAYGHSPDGHSWRIERDLEPLLQTVVNLLDRTRGALLVTGHSPGFDGHWVQQYLVPQLQQHLGLRPKTFERQAWQMKVQEIEVATTNAAQSRPGTPSQQSTQTAQGTLGDRGQCRVEHGRSVLTDVHQRTLDAGFFVRIHW